MPSWQLRNSVTLTPSCREHRSTQASDGRLKISKALANLRERASNVPNAAGFDLQEAGPYDLIDGKWVTLESEDVRPPKPARVGYALKTWRERPLS